MRCKGEFKNDRTCDMCFILNPILWKECEEILQGKKNKEKEKYQLEVLCGKRHWSRTAIICGNVLNKKVLCDSDAPYCMHYKK